MPPFVGFSIREQNRSVLSDRAIEAAEITFERADDPLRTDRYVGDRDFEYVSVHALKLSVGSPEPPAWRYLEGLHAIACENAADAISDHLAFTRDGEGGVEMGHFAPLPFTRAALDACCRNINVIQEYFDPLNFFIENVAAPFQLRGTMSEQEFLARVLERTGCGWLLDVTNVYANSRNFGFNPYEFVSDVLPVPRRVQIHLSGGHWDEAAEFYVDSHSQPIPEEIWGLYRHALEVGRGKIAAVFIERDQDFPNEAGWLGELRQARELAETIEVIA